MSIKPKTPFDDLSPRERAIAVACAAGVERAVTASSLAMRLRDLENHLNNAMLKLGVANLSELVRLAVGWGVIPALPAPLAKPPDSSTAEARAQILERMGAASAVFASAAANTGCTAFMVFTSAVRDFVSQCAEAEAAGANWIGASVQGVVDGNEFTLRARLPGPRRVP